MINFPLEVRMVQVRLEQSESPRPIYLTRSGATWEEEYRSALAGRMAFQGL